MIKEIIESKFEVLKFMQQNTDNDLLKEWKFALKDDWVTVYRSEFGGQVSYENDGVLTLSFNKFMDEDYFEDARNTSCEDLMIKLRYVLTVLSKFYYNKIDEQEYIELVSILDIAK